MEDHRVHYLVGAAIVWLIVGLTEATEASMLLTFCIWAGATPVGMFLSSRLYRSSR